MTTVRCAIYTRKSSDEGLDQAFNSLDAQREACAAYIKSQKHEGWKALATRYDDGGVSGGTIARPALQLLLTEIDAGRVDMVVVYKIDRLTRSLSDFAKLVDRLDAAGASFVSVTQQFNTSTSMGRLTLNVLLSFAQFEREVTAERIRDKIAASKKKGMWMGGLLPLGYDKTDDRLIINHQEAETVRALFEAYLTLGCVRKLKGYADGNKLRTKLRPHANGSARGGVCFSRGRLYHLLSNPVYIGKVRHKKDVYDGLHDRILDQALWDQVQEQLASNRVARKSRTNAANPSPLASKVFDQDGLRLTPTHANKQGRRYRYYISSENAKSPQWRLPAAELEAAVFTAISEDRSVRLHLNEAGADRPKPAEIWNLVDLVSVQEDRLVITVTLGNERPYQLSALFTLRRRGVESKLVLDGTASRDPDLIMIRRILRAMKWVDQIKAGKTVKAVATSENISGNFITHNIDLAYLSPEILNLILDGRQRPDLTTAELSKRRWSVDWSQQKIGFLA